MDVEQIRAKIKETYNSFSSYQDSGEIHSYNFDQGVGWFTTSFLRPNQLIFEFSHYGMDKGNKTTLMVKGDRFQLIGSGDFAERNRKQSPDFAKTEVVMSNNWPMSGAGGVTFGMSDTILPMLIPKSGRPCFIHEKLALLRDAIIDGEPCFHIREIYQPHHVWVSQNDFTIRRAEGDGYSPLSNIMTGYLTKLLRLRAFFSREPEVPEGEMRKILESSTSSDWKFKTIQYNHLNAETFPKFEFRTVQRR